MKSHISNQIDNDVQRKRETESLSNDSLINVDISNVLTPVACAFLVNEILQGLLYQKSQIPYPYSWMKCAVEKKRKNDNSQETKRPVNFSVANHFRVVSTAYDTLENVMKGIIAEFKEKSNDIKEIVFIFGITPQCPKEIYTIKVSSLAKGHLEENHAHPMCKYRQNILQNIFLSQRWLDAFDNSMVCTNTYIFLKKSIDSNTSPVYVSDNVFIPSRPLIFPPRIKHIKINLNYEHNDKTKTNCCEDFFVFEDVSDIDTVKERQDSSTNEETRESVLWYQSKDFFKGFKDCYINKVSATELW